MYKEFIGKEYKRLFGENKFCELYLYQTSAYFDNEPCYIVKCKNCSNHFVSFNTKKYCEDKIKKFKKFECKG